MPTDYKIEEWKNLYSEIHNNSRSINTALTLVFGGTPTIIAAIINLGGNDYGGSIFLIPFILIIPATIFIYSQLDSTARISAYITVFHERRTKGLKWETRLGLLNQHESKNQLNKFEWSISLMLSGIAGFTFMVALVMTVLYFNNNENDGRLWVLDLMIVLLVGLQLATVLWRYLRRIKLSISDGASNYRKKWEELEEAIPFPHHEYFSVKAKP